MSKFKIIKYVYYSFLLIGIFFTLLTTLRMVYHYIPNMSMIGERPETLGFYSFWIDVLGSIASFSMVYITALSVNLNEKQLRELKRQWDAEHLAYLSCQLIAKRDNFLLRIVNSSDITANRVKISIESKLLKHDDSSYFEPFNFGKLKEFLKTQEFVIPPKESIYFTIWITPYKEVEHLPTGYILISLCDEVSDYGAYKLYPQNYAFASFETENVGDTIVEAISEVGRKIENKRYLFK